MTYQRAVIVALWVTTVIVWMLAFQQGWVR